MFSLSKNIVLGMVFYLGLISFFLPPQADPTVVTDHSLGDIPPSSLVYVSDYFSFVGQDSQGKVVFALDNKRGRDGDAYQAEHFLVLHDEKMGWVNVKGNSRYDNAGKELKTIPDSPFFRFQGTPATGMTIVSEINRLALNIEPITQRTGKRHHGAVVLMGTAPAVLTWQDRTISGRVMYAYLMMPDFNRLTRTYWDIWDEYQGFYLRMGMEGDVYLHSQRSEHLAPLIGFLSGFTAANSASEFMNDLKVEVLDRQLARGFYRWPIAWRVTWTGPQGSAVLTLKQVTRTSIWNWAIGGFSMVVVEGELNYAGKNQPVYGLAELIM
jgi:hypothetical protein